MLACMSVYYARYCCNHFTHKPFLVGAGSILRIPSLHVFMVPKVFCCFVVSRFGARGGGGLPPKKFGNPGERLRKKKWDLSELPKFEKNFYVEHPEVARLTPVSFGEGVIYLPFFHM